MHGYKFLSLSLFLHSRLISTAGGGTAQVTHTHRKEGSCALIQNKKLFEGSFLRQTRSSPATPLSFTLFSSLLFSYPSTSQPPPNAFRGTRWAHDGAFDVSLLLLLLFSPSPSSSPLFSPSSMSSHRPLWMILGVFLTYAVTPKHKPHTKKNSTRAPLPLSPRFVFSSFLAILTAGSVSPRRHIDHASLSYFSLFFFLYFP